MTKTPNYIIEANKVDDLTAREIMEMLEPLEAQNYINNSNATPLYPTASSSLNPFGSSYPDLTLKENSSKLNDIRLETTTLLRSQDCIDNERLDPIIIKFALTHLSFVIKELYKYIGKSFTIITDNEAYEFEITEKNIPHLLGLMSTALLDNSYINTTGNSKYDVKYIDDSRTEFSFPTTESTDLMDQINNYTTFTDENGNPLYDLTKTKVLEKIAEILDQNKDTWKKLLYEIKHYDATSSKNHYTEAWNKICFKTANIETIFSNIITNGINNIELFSGERYFYGTTRIKTKSLLFAQRYKNSGMYSCITFGYEPQTVVNHFGNTIPKKDSAGNVLFTRKLFPLSSEFMDYNRINDIKTGYRVDNKPLLGNKWSFIDSKDNKFLLCLDKSINISISPETIDKVKILSKRANNHKDESILDIYRIKSNNEEVIEIIDSYKQELSNFLVNNQEKLENMLKDLFDNSKTKKELKLNLPELLIQYFQYSSNNEDLKNAYLSIAKSSISNKDMLNLISLSYINNQEWLKTELFKDRPFNFNYSLTKSNDYNLKFNILVNGKELNFEGSINEFLDNYYDLIQSLIIELKDDIDNVEIKNIQQAKDYLYNLNVYNQLCVLFDSSVADIMSSISTDRFGFTQRNIRKLKEDNKEVYNKLFEIGCLKETDELFFETQRNIPISSIKENYLKSIAYNKAINNLNNIPEDTNEYLISYISSLTEEELLNNLIGNNYSDILNDLNDLDNNLTAKDIKDRYELTSEQVDIILNIQELNLYGNLLNNLNDKEKTDGLLRKINMVYANRNPLVVSLNKQKVLKLENVG